eukprot:TRINITY_DN5859_c0_g1_i1.p1 TRINITY_DN5859_c0_g1~~TRINITY_DN5859_c0_g1_i1.p1  ORF type:complete len:541 (-),score=138.11 TRINITY_DN5859_c0_g1_i1:765-2387(-)
MGQNASKRRVSDLPKDILMKIFALLEYDDLLRVMCVCKSFHLVGKDNRLWSKLYRNAFKELLPVPFVRTMDWRLHFMARKFYTPPAVKSLKLLADELEMQVHHNNSSSSQPNTRRISPKYSLIGSEDRILSLSWSGDSTRLAVATKEGEILLYELDITKSGMDHLLPKISSSEPTFGSTDFVSKVSSISGSKSIIYSPSVPSLSTSPPKELIKTESMLKPKLSSISSENIGVKRMIQKSGSFRSLQSMQHKGVSHNESSERITKSPKIQTRHSRSMSHYTPKGPKLQGPIFKECTGRISLTSVFVIVCKFSPSGKFVASAGLDNTCTIHEVKDNMNGGVVWSSLKGHDSFISDMSFMNDNNILTASGDNSCILWDIDTTQVIHQFKSHKNEIQRIAVDLDRNVFFSASSDCTVKMWDLRTREVVRDFIGHKKDVNCVSVSWDGREILTAGEEGSSKIFDVKTGKQRIEFKDSFSFTSASFSLFGEQVYICGEEKYALVFDAQTGESLGKLHHEGRVSCLSIPPNGKCLVTGGWDNQILIW